jgi:hypothetical protein
MTMADSSPERQGVSRSGSTSGRGGGIRTWITAVLRRPEVVTDVLQILKCVLAATAAWWFATAVMSSEMPFLAPWTALLTVHATVYRSFARGVQTTVSSGLGVLLSYLIGAFLGVELWTFALALLVGLVASRLWWIRDEGIAIATTAVFVLGSGFGEQAPLLTDRLVEVGVGVAFGILVNVLVVPPLRDAQASRYVDRINQLMGELLVDMSEELTRSWDTEHAEHWGRRIAEMQEMIGSAWQSVRFARESTWANPRSHRLAPGRRGHSENRPAEYREILERVDEGIAHMRNLTRTLREASYAHGEWDRRFRTRWSAIVHDAGRAIADPDAEVEPIHDRLTELAVQMAEDERMPADSWPVYGALIRGMQHIAVVVDDVASARAAREA